MKIGLTVKGSGLGAWLDDDFAECMQVMFVNDDNSFYAWPNPFRESEDNSVLKLAEMIVAEQIDVLITSQISVLASDILSKAGMKVMVKENGTVFELVDEARQTN